MAVCSFLLLHMRLTNPRMSPGEVPIGQPGKWTAFIASLLKIYPQADGRDQGPEDQQLGRETGKTRGGAAIY